MTAVSRLTTDDVMYVYDLVSKNKLAEAQDTLDVCAEGCRKGMYDTNPEMPDALADLAEAMVKKAKTHQAAHELATLFFDSALKINPTHLRALVSYGRLLYNVQSNFAKAHRCFEAALSLDCNNIKALESLGDLLRVGGNGVDADHPQAIQLLERALSINPQSAIALESLATLYIDSVTLAKIKYDEAKKPNDSVLKAKTLFERLLKERPNNVAALSHLANMVHFGIGGVPKDEIAAAIYCKRILVLDPTNEFANIIKLDALQIDDH